MSHSSHHVLRNLSTNLAAAFIGAGLVAGNALYAQVDFNRVTDRKILRERVRLTVAEIEQERQDIIQNELNILRERRTTLEERLDYARAVVLNSFERDAQGIIPRTQRIVPTFERWAHRRKAMLHSLLEYRDRARGSIASGVAQNFLLQVCGPAAYEHNFSREQGDDGNEKQQILTKITDELRLGPEITSAIRYRQGLSGSPLTGRLYELPLDTKWPNVLQAPVFQKNTANIERVRDEILHELEQGNPVSPDAADELLDEAHELMGLIQQERQGTLRAIRRRVSLGGPATIRIPSHRDSIPDWNRYQRAERHTKQLIAGAFRLIEATKTQDVMLDVSELQRLNEAEGGITVEQLMAFMFENNLYFHDADANGQIAYNRIFEQMSNYYVNLFALKASMEELEEVKRQEQAMIKLATESTMKDIKKYESRVAVADAVSDALDLVTDIVDID